MPTTMADVRGVPAEDAHKVDWKSGGGPETDLYKRYLNKKLKKKKNRIVRRTLNRIQKES